MKKIKTSLVGVSALLSVLISAPANAVWTMEIESYVGDFHGSAEVCKAIMPDEVSAGLSYLQTKVDADLAEMLKRAESDDSPDARRSIEELRTRIGNLQTSDSYKQAFQEEKLRLQGMTPTDLKKACEWNWGSFRKKSATQAP